MKYGYIIISIILCAAFVVSCAKESDEDAIQALLESSSYVGDGDLETTDDGTNEPVSMQMSVPLLDTLGYVRWVRWIERPITREFDIVVTGDTADVIITAYFDGTPPGYGLFVNNDPFGPVYNRAISDIAVRRVQCYRDEENTWHIGKLTVADGATYEALHPVTITEIRAEVVSRGYEFVVDDPEMFFTRQELPTFYPEDTVEVTVTCSADGDSTWAFLHHGTGHRPGHGIHIRQPFYRDNTTTFTRTWVIADDSILVTPAVRHAAVDVLGWQTLFGDDSACYYARVWALPYIVMEPGQEIPDDTE
jgi:hypothetical protein